MGNLVSAAKPNPAGVVWYAPFGTTLPTDATSTLDSSFVDLGYVSEDGISNATERSVESIKEMGGNEVLAIQTEFSDKFTFTLLESKNVDVRKAVFGNSHVSGSLKTGMSTEVSSDELEYMTWVFEMVLSDGDIQRTVIPSAKITEIPERVYKNSEPIGYEVTLSAQPVEGTNIYHYEYLVSVGDESE